MNESLAHTISLFFNEMLRNLPVYLLISASLGVAANTPAAYTFSRDVLPILQKRCQDCHRPGEIGPMPLLTYKEVRPWAKAIRESVVTRKMPPWHADPGVSRFRNDHSLTDAEIGVVARWADAGAPEGNPKDAPAAAQFAEGWKIGTPDAILSQGYLSMCRLRGR